MDGTLSRLLESLTIDEQAEVETFAMFILARRKLHKLDVAAEDISAEELMRLVADSGSFDWLNAPEEDVYSVEDGKAVPPHSILELKGLGKELWKGIDGQEYVEQERRSWRE